MNNRVVALNRIEKNDFDLCVIGGGATGAGCALMLNCGGSEPSWSRRETFRALLPAGSTKLIHGGVRYLQQAISERDLANIMW